VLISAGDPSGDLLLSKILARLKERAAPEPIEFVGLAGVHCEAVGARLLERSENVAVVGFLEVLTKLRSLFSILHRLIAELPKVDSVILVDFPDFNFRLARAAKKLSKPVDYVVAPQLWAWRRSRVNEMRRWVRRLYPALPFEETLFREAGVDTRFLGHPMRDLLPPKARRSSREALGLSQDSFVVAVLPGSRSGEILRHMPMLIEASERLFNQRRRLFPLQQSLVFLMPLAPGWDLERLRHLLPSSCQEKLKKLIEDRLWVVDTDSHRSLMASDFGWVASGTATLEAAFYQVPHILIYRLSRVSAWIIQSMTSYFRNSDGMAGLPNLILGRKVIPELLQGDLDSKRLVSETVELLTNASRLDEIKKSLRFVPKRMGEHGCSNRIADDLWELWNRP
jgi:lipid-A-disaccharide synthase